MNGKEKLTTPFVSNDDCMRVIEAATLRFSAGTMQLNLPNCGVKLLRKFGCAFYILLILIIGNILEPFPL